MTEHVADKQQLDAFDAFHTYLASLLETAARLCADLSGRRAVGPNMDLQPFSKEGISIGMQVQDLGAVWSVLTRHQDEALNYFAKHPAQDPEHALPAIVDRLGKFNTTLVQIVAQTRRQVNIAPMAATGRYLNNRADSETSLDFKTIVAVITDRSHAAGASKLCTTMQTRGSDLWIAASRVCSYGRNANVAGGCTCSCVML